MLGGRCLVERESAMAGSVFDSPLKAALVVGFDALVSCLIMSTAPPRGVYLLAVLCARTTLWSDRCYVSSPQCSVWTQGSFRYIYMVYYKSPYGPTPPEGTQCAPATAQANRPPPQVSDPKLASCSIELNYIINQ
jgi:hypothetical protein